MAKHTILFLAADPGGMDRRALDREAHAIHAELKRCGYRDSFELVTRWAVEPLDLLRELRELKPTVVHFSGRSGPGGMQFQDSEGRARVVSTAALAEAFGAAGAQVQVVVLSAGYSEESADALLAHVDCVVGMGGAIHDDAARSFAVGFYGALGEHESVEAACRHGSAAINLAGLPDAERPRLRVRAGADARRIVLAAAPAIREELPCPYPEMWAYTADVADHLHGRQQLVASIPHWVSRPELEGILYEIGKGHLLDEMPPNVSYTSFARFMVTRAVVGGWLRQLVDALHKRAPNAPGLTKIRASIPVSVRDNSPEYRRKRIAKLLQRMSYLEGQQVQTPGYLAIGYQHERACGESSESASATSCDDHDDLMSGYMAAIDLESIRDHLHDVLETTVTLIGELDQDAIVAEEVPDAYVMLMRGLNARARILRTALRHGCNERDAADYYELMRHRDDAVDTLINRLLKLRT